MTVIPVPSLSGYNITSHYKKALKTIQRLRGVESDEIVLSMQNANWVTPSFSAPIAVECSRLASAGKEIRTRIPNAGLREYLGQIEFPLGTTDPMRSFENHLPLCRLADTGNMLVETVGQELRELITQDYTEEVNGCVSALTYPINEIVENVSSHSACDFGTVLVQHYPSRSMIDICVADDGISIPGSFDDFGIEYESHEDAIRKAAVDGVSTREGDEHGDSGFGLRTTIAMVCEGTGGSAMISSGDCTMYRNSTGGLQRRSSRHSWSGTVFAARLQFPLDDEFRYLDYV